MRKFALSLLSFLCCACILFAGTTCLAVGETESLIDGIVDYRLKESGCSSVQSLAQKGLSSGAGKGASEWYAIGLSAYYKNLDLSGYSSALSSYLSSNKISSATSRQRCALSLIACGKGGDSFVSSTAADSVGSLGIMSYIFGLQLANNGAPLSVSKDGIISEILSLENADGGWSVSGSNSDVDVTAMALAALAPYKNGSAADAVERGLSFLSSKQLESGGFMSYGKENAESSAQVIVALTALGINPKTDGRFVKNGCSVFSALSGFRLSDGSFCHIKGGTSNGTATVQAFYSLVALWRFENGLPSLFTLSVKGTKALPSSDSGKSPSESPRENHFDSKPGDAPAEISGTEAEDKESGGDISSDAQSDEFAEQTEDSAISSADSKSETISPSKGTEKSGEKGFFKSYKPWTILGIILICAAVCLVMRLKKHKNIKNYLFVGAIGLVLSLAVAFTSFSSVDNHYTPVSKEGSAGTVTVSIRCDTLTGKSDNSFVPENGIILDSTEIPLESGETAFDILGDVSRTYGIQVESTGTGGDNSLAYIKGINYIYEFDGGDLSGWMYRVNGEFPSVSCGAFTLSDGDKVEWLYTCDLGNDLN